MAFWSRFMDDGSKAKAPLRTDAAREAVVERFFTPGILAKKEPVLEVMDEDIEAVIMRIL
jgi:hypothetical protein